MREVVRKIALVTSVQDLFDRPLFGLNLCTEIILNLRMSHFLLYRRKSEWQLWSTSQIIGWIKALRAKLAFWDVLPFFNLHSCFAASDRLGFLPACPHTDDSALYSAGPELCYLQTHTLLKPRIQTPLQTYRQEAMLVRLCVRWLAVTYSQKEFSPTRCWMLCSLKRTHIYTGELCLSQVFLQTHGLYSQQAVRHKASSKTDSCFLTSVHLRESETEAGRAGWWLHFRHQRMLWSKNSSSRRRGEGGAIRWTVQANRNI